MYLKEMNFFISTLTCIFDYVLDTPIRQNQILFVFALDLFVSLWVNFDLSSQKHRHRDTPG